MPPTPAADKTVAADKAADTTASDKVPAAEVEGDVPDTKSGEYLLVVTDFDTDGFRYDDGPDDIVTKEPKVIKGKKNADDLIAFAAAHGVTLAYVEKG